MAIRPSTVILLLIFNTGCGSMSGLTENTKFACKAPDGVACTSVSGVYANAQQNNLPALQKPVMHASASTASTVNMPAAPAPAMPFPALQAGTPIRSQPHILRLWLAPWRDEDDSLHDQSYVYVMVDSGQWLVDRSREATVQKSMSHLQRIGAARDAGTSPPAASAAPAGTMMNVRENPDAQASAREAAVIPPDGEPTK